MKDISCECGVSIRYSRGDINRRYLKIDGKRRDKIEFLYCPKCLNRVEINNGNKEQSNNN